jgi:hypothetical protein
MRCVQREDAGYTQGRTRRREEEVTTMIWTILAVIGLIAVLVWLF